MRDGRKTAKAAQTAPQARADRIALVENELRLRQAIRQIDRAMKRSPCKRP